MSGLAHYIEAAGVPTTGISLIRRHSEVMRPPRALYCRFELGRPFGAPDQPDFQRRVLQAALALLAREDGPVVLADFPDDPPGGEADGAGWACPVNFAPPVDALSDADVIYNALAHEAAQLRPWYDEAVRRYRRSAFGIAGRTTDEIARFLADFVVDPAGTPSPIDGLPIGHAYKRCADDMRYFYTEAAIARPDRRATDLEVANWLWGETTLGKLLVAVRDFAMECDEPSLRQLAPTAMVPTHQRHRTRHG